MTAQIGSVARAPRWVTLFSPILKFLLAARRSAGLQRAHHHSRPEERPASHHAGGDHRRSRAGAGSGLPGARSTGCATCARPAARPSPCAAGRKRSVRPSWTRRSESGSFATSLVPLARSIPFGVTVHSHRRWGRSRRSGGGGRGSTCLRAPPTSVIDRRFRGRPTSSDAQARTVRALARSAPRSPAQGNNRCRQATCSRMQDAARLAPSQRLVVVVVRQKDGSTVGRPHGAQQSVTRIVGVRLTRRDLWRYPRRPGRRTADSRRYPGWYRSMSSFDPIRARSAMGCGNRRSDRRWRPRSGGQQRQPGPDREPRGRRNGWLRQRSGDMLRVRPRTRWWPRDLDDDGDIDLGLREPRRHGLGIHRRWHRYLRPGRDLRPCGTPAH